MTTTTVEKPIRSYLPQDLKIESWESIEQFFEELLSREINSVEELDKWLRDRSELDAVLEEDAAWRYIRMNIDTTDPELLKSYEFFLTEISPKMSPYADKLNRKLVESKFVDQLDKDKYFIFLRGVKKEIELYREENIPLYIEIQKEAQKYGSISAAMTVTIDGKEMTLQQASKLLEENDREKRRQVFEQISQRRLQDLEKLNDLFNKLIALRQRVATNAGFKNYRDYKFEELGRFDYTVENCRDFHKSIAKEIVPINKTFNEERKKALGLDVLKPWDLEVDPTGKAPLKPFATGEELLQKTIECFNRINPYYAGCISTMKKMGHLDLESKKGKAPGGFNYPLYESGVPFIFMNAAGTLRDVITMVHEGGHAIHSFLTHDLELTYFKSFPSEVAELASMSMELISMEHWDVFFNNEDDLKRAKRDQLEKVLSTLPWVATIDMFQHWIYENPDHTVEERQNEWLRIREQFSTHTVDWSGYEEVFAYSWQRQLHLYEVPFYYIEYGMAQLGAIAMWRNYKNDPPKALKGYEAALKLGYTKKIGDIYKAAGISFDFSKEYVSELADFVKNEFKKI